MEAEWKTRRNDLLGMNEPSDHKHRAAEKRSPPGTFEHKLDTEICSCGARRFAYMSGEPATGWFIWPSRSKTNSL